MFRAFRYCRENGIKKTIQRFVLQIRMQKELEHTPDYLRDYPQDILSRGYAYKFARYCEDRNAQYQLDFRDFDVGFEKGKICVIINALRLDERIERIMSLVLSQTYCHIELILAVCKTRSAHVQQYADLNNVHVLEYEQKWHVGQILHDTIVSCKGEFSTILEDAEEASEKWLEDAIERLNQNGRIAMDCTGIPVYRNSAIQMMGEHMLKRCVICNEDVQAWIRDTFEDRDESIVNILHGERMLRRDSRQDFLLRPMCWVVEDQDFELKDRIIEIGHIKMDEIQAKCLCWPPLGSMMVQVNTRIGDKADEPLKERIVEDSICVLICDEMNSRDDQFYDYVICLNECVEKRSPKHYFVRNRDCVFDLIQVLCKTRWMNEMYRLEQQEASRRATIVLCTYKRCDVARRALKAMCRQSVDYRDYEILIINNDPKNREMQKMAYDIQRQEQITVKYFDCPYPGLSAARNFSLYTADGEIVLFVDDDGLMKEDCLEALLHAFHMHPEASIIGGQILLCDAQRFADVILPGYERLWSEKRSNKTQYYQVDCDADLPYGCNYAIRRKQLRNLGGFRKTYGRSGNDFSGGEEMVLSRLAWLSGSCIGFEPKAIVMHDVDPSRYTLVHAKKTIRSSIMTERMMRMDLYQSFDLGMNIERRMLCYVQAQIGLLPKRYKENGNLEYIYMCYERDAILEAIEEGKRAIQSVAEHMGS